MWCTEHSQARFHRAVGPPFDSAEIVELTATVTTATVTTAIAFSKAAVAFGAPEDMPVLEVPTPALD